MESRTESRTGGYHVNRILVMLCLLGLGQPVTGSVIELQAPGDIRDIETLDAQVDQLVLKVRQCAEAGLAPINQCFCYYPAKLASTRTAYRKVIVKHPEWEDMAIHWRKSDRLNLSGLRKRIQSCS